MVKTGGVLVEFVGLPASGKTWVARQAAEQVRADRLASDDRPVVTTSSGIRNDTTASWVRRGGRLLGRTLVNPGRSMRQAEGIVSSRQHSPSKAFKFFWYQQYLLDEFHSARRAGRVHLADQGFLQHLWRVHLTARADEHGYLRQLVRSWERSLLPDIVIFVNVEHQIRMERANERGTPVDAELFDPDHPLIQDDLRSYAEIKRFIRTEWGDDIPIIEIDNREDNVEENLNAIARPVADRLARDDQLESDPPASR